MKDKSETSDNFKILHAQAKNLHKKSILRIRSDHGKEFENAAFIKFCNENGIHHEFFAPITPQQNGVAERKNMTFTRNGTLHVV